MHRYPVSSVRSNITSLWRFILKSVSLLIVLSFLAVSCGGAPEPEPAATAEPAAEPAAAVPAGTQEDPFIGQGFVREIGDDGVLTIEHGEIPGFMAAMTMPYSVADEALLESIAIDDEIKFSIESLADGYHIFAIEKPDGEGSEEEHGEEGDADSESDEGPTG